MKGILRRLRPSPAMVVACTALLFAMTGAGYAAGMLGPNTVGTKQLKKNAVISSKVKNGSLLRADFKSGQIPAGPQGPKGDKGDTGPPGAPNPNADTLNGYAAGELNRQANLAFAAFQALPPSNSQFAQIQITAPKRGYLHATASFYTLFSAGAGFPCVEKWWQTLDTTDPNALIQESFVAENALASGLQLDNQTSQATVLVNPGLHTLRLIYTEESGGCRAAGTFAFGRGGWSVQFIPFNASGIPPAAAGIARVNGGSTASTQ